MKVSLFVSCLVDQVFPNVGLSTLRLMDRLGIECEFDSRQTCCGQPALNSGFPGDARKVASHLLGLFDDSEAIVVPAGSCSTMLKVFLPGLFQGGTIERAKAESISAKTWELSDFLVRRLGVVDVGARFPAVVTYHDSCHLLRELNIRNQPRKLIREVRGIEFREMPDSERCCGFGGTFSVKFDDVSSAIGTDKLKAIQATGAEYVIANDVSCLMHIGGLLSYRGIGVTTLHLAELLATTG